MAGLKGKCNHLEKHLKDKEREMEELQVKHQNEIKQLVDNHQQALN